MTTKSPPKAPPPPPPLPADDPVPTVEELKRKFFRSSGPRQQAQKVGIYGPGGVGKTSLLANMVHAARTPCIIDLDEGSASLNVARITGVETWDDLRTILKDDALWKKHDTVCIDSVTKAEELAVAWTLENVLHPDHGYKVARIEGYGYGKGYQFVYETFLLLLADLERHLRANRDIVCVCHECTVAVINPEGEDYARYEPRLQSPSSGKASIRHRLKEWLDHLFFVGYDIDVDKKGKARGSGTRTIYTEERPGAWAKSRSPHLREPIPYGLDSADVWNLVFKEVASAKA